MSAQLPSTAQALSVSSPGGTGNGEADGEDAVGVFDGTETSLETLMKYAFDSWNMASRRLGPPGQMEVLVVGGRRLKD